MEPDYVEEPVSDGDAPVAEALTGADAAPTGDTEVEADFLPAVDVEALIIERDELMDTARRLKADFENYRKRVAAQQTDEIDRATGRLVESLLPVLDACEAAFTHGAEGVEPVWSALMSALQKQGLEALDLQDQPFDPTVADAVVSEPGDGETVVAEVLRTGYRWKGKVVRAAMVKVRG